VASQARKGVGSQEGEEMRRSKEKGGIGMKTNRVISRGGTDRTNEGGQGETQSSQLHFWVTFTSKTALREDTKDEFRGHDVEGGSQEKFRGRGTP